MQKPEKAKFVVHWYQQAVEEIKVLFNPTELSFEKGAQIAEVAIPGLDSPLLQFVRGQNEKLTLELFCDTTDKGMSGKKITSVTTETDKIYGLIKIEPGRHAPPICDFVWNDKFPGSDISEKLGNQRRNNFKCIVESVRQKFTLFSPEGVPLRATLTVVLREYKTFDSELALQNPNSPDRTQSHVVRSGETLSGISAQYYDKPTEWRRIADTNHIEDPRRLVAGTFLKIDPITD
jgi:hypothetical protein